MTPQTSSTNFSQTHSWAVQSWRDQNYGSYTPELGPVGFWSPKSSSFSGSDSIVVEEVQRSCKKLSKSTAEYKQVAQSEFLIQHDKVEASKLRRYLETWAVPGTVSTKTNVLQRLHKAQCICRQLVFQVYWLCICSIWRFFLLSYQI